MNLNKKGMSIVEVMMALGISSLLFLGLSSKTQETFSSKTTINAAQDLNGLMYELNGILNNPPVCTTAMTTLSVSSSSGQDLQISKDLRAGAKIGTLSVTSVTLQSVTQVSGFYRMAVVQVQGQYPVEILGSTTFTQQSKFYYAVDTNNKITQCLNIPGSPAANCNQLGGFWTGQMCNFCKNGNGTVLPDGSCQMLNSSSYAWLEGQWGSCTGTQTRNVECIDVATTAVMPDTYCQESKPTAVRSCGGAAYLWRTTDWGTCVGSSKSRTVNCVDALTETATADVNCTAGPKPISTLACGTFAWQPGAWGWYSYGSQMRDVACIDPVTKLKYQDGRCTGPKPVDTQGCSGSTHCHDDILNTGHDHGYGSGDGEGDDNGGYND